MQEIVWLEGDNDGLLLMTSLLEDVFFRAIRKLLDGEFTVLNDFLANTFCEEDYNDCFREGLICCRGSLRATLMVDGS